VIFPMPLYEYRCKDCGHVFEKMVRFSEADRAPICPTCHSQETHKKVSAVASFGSSSGSAGFSSGSSCGTGSRFS